MKFTAETLRTQRRNFRNVLFGGEIPPNKIAFVLLGRRPSKDPAILIQRGRIY
jgi:hypothetical protein